MIVQKDRFVCTSTIFIALLICVLFSSVKAFSYIAFCLYIFYWLYLYHYNKTYFVKYFAFVFITIGTVLGAAIIELFPEQYLSELRCQSHFSGSLPLIIFSYWIFLYVLEIREYHYGENIRKIQVDSIGKGQSKRVINIFAFGSGILLVVLFGYVATHTLPTSLLGGDRFRFGLIYEMPWIISEISAFSYLLLIFPLLALVYANRIVAVVSIFAYCAFNFWIGEKFGAFFTLMCILLIVMYNKILLVNQKKLKKYLIGIIAVFLVLLVVAVAIISSSTDSNPYEYFTQRAAQQGQLWWRTYDLYSGTVHPNEFVNEINAFIEGEKTVRESVGANNGIYKVMYLCTPESVVSSRLAGGSRYTQADYAVMYYYFGIPGVIIYSIIMGLIISCIVNSFIHALQIKEYIKAVIYLRFFIMIRVSFSMFAFGGFLSFLSILSYVYLIFTHGRRLQFRFHKSMKSQVGNGEINV